MRYRLASLALLASTFCVSPVVMAADDPKPAPTPGANDKPAAGGPGQGAARGGPGQGGGGGQRGGPGGGQGGPGGGGGFGRGPGGPGGGMNFTADPLDELVRALGELNLNPGFTLSDDQKLKIKEMRDALKKEKEQWRTDHEAEFKKIQDDFTALRSNAAGGGNVDADREKFQALDQSRRDLMAEAPKSDETIVNVKSLLTNNQLKALDARLAERKAENDRRGRGPGGGGPGQGNGGGPGNPGGGGAGGRTTPGGGGKPGGEKPGI